ncbi:hypothetical protein [uncultured Gammaproteobacteria bacterium]|nr:hypothetical protein [uncultured Gammaproteobacteria bacterium]
MLAVGQKHQKLRVLGLGYDVLVLSPIRKKNNPRFSCWLFRL